MKNVLSAINKRLSNAKTLIRYFPLVLKHGKGIRVTDMNDKEYIDCISAAGALPFGHNHFVFKNAMQEFINNDYPVQTMDIATELQYQFHDRLFNFLPQEFSKNAKIQMCSPSGGDAIEAAIKLVKIATGRNTILSFCGGYHGQSYASSSISGKLRGRNTYSGMTDVHFLPYPNTYRSPFQIGRDNSEFVNGYINNILRSPQSGISKPAAIILESVQGEGGVNPAPISWLKEIRKTTQELGIPLILDEIQTGFCRTGKKFGFEYADITPDVICIAKALGGSIPLSVLLHSSELDKWDEYQHAGTWRGNQMGFLAGTRSLEYMEQEKLWENASIMGEKFMSYMESLKHIHPFIGDIRGRGLMLGIEIVDYRTHQDKNGTYKPD